jgi:hypothetical protein
MVIYLQITTEMCGYGERHRSHGPAEVGIITLTDDVEQRWSFHAALQRWDGYTDISSPAFDWSCILPRKYWSQWNIMIRYVWWESGDIRKKKDVRAMVTDRGIYADYTAV